jgi:hypothetical protein
MNKFCAYCGAPVEEGFTFCKKCGQHVMDDTAPAAAAAPRQTVLPRQAAGIPQNAVYPPRMKPGGGKLLAIILSCAVLVIAALLVIFLVPGIVRPAQSVSGSEKSVLEPLPASLVYQEGEVKVQCTYDAPDEIIPAIYRSMDDIVYMKCWCDNGTADLMVTAEIPGFTQKYQQKISVNRMETQLKIHPPLVEDVVKSLNSSKNVQLEVSVKDMNTGEVIVQDTKNIKLYSRYDMLWQDKDGTAYYENYLAWLTPEATEIKELLRASADALKELEGYDAIVGYQNMGSFSHQEGTAYQTMAMMYAMAKYYQVKYVAASFFFHRYAGAAMRYTRRGFEQPRGALLRDGGYDSICTAGDRHACGADPFAGAYANGGGDLAQFRRLYTGRDDRAGAGSSAGLGTCYWFVHQRELAEIPGR